jgi:hypothetical protein
MRSDLDHNLGAGLTLAWLANGTGNERGVSPRVQRGSKDHESTSAPQVGGKSLLSHLRQGLRVDECDNDVILSYPGRRSHVRRPFQLQTANLVKP